MSLKQDTEEFLEFLNCKMKDFVDDDYPSTVYRGFRAIRDAATAVSVFHDSGDVEAKWTSIFLREVRDIKPETVLKILFNPSLTHGSSKDRNKFCHHLETWSNGMMNRYDTTTGFTKFIKTILNN